MNASKYDFTCRQQAGGTRRMVECMIATEASSWSSSPYGRSLVLEMNPERRGLHHQSIIRNTTEQTVAAEESPMTVFASNRIRSAMMKNGAITRTAGSVVNKNDIIIPRKLDHVGSCGPMDILAGRIGKPKEEIVGKGHPATKIFDETIVKNLQAYQVQSRRKDRSHLIKKVVAELLSQGCRFLKYDGKIDKFLVLDEKQIRDKVSFAFRHQSSKHHEHNNSKCASSRNKRNAQKESYSKRPLCEAKQAVKGGKKTDNRPRPSDKNSSSLIVDRALWGLREEASFLSLQQPGDSPQLQRKTSISQRGHLSERIEKDERDFIDILEDVWADDLSAANEDVTSFDFLDNYGLPGIEFKTRSRKQRGSVSSF